MKRRPLFFLYLTVFINMVGFGMVFPLLPFYAQTFNATPFQIGLLAMSFSITQFFTAPVLGRISDRIGRKPVLVIGLLAGTLSMAFMGFANSLLLLFIGRAFHGAVSAAILPTGRAYMADITTEDVRVAGMGKVGAAFAAGFLFGPAFGAIVASVGNIHTPFFAAATVSAFNAISVLLFLSESLSTKTDNLHVKESLTNLFKMFKYVKGETGIFFIIVFAWSFALSNNQVAFPLLTSSKFGLDATSIGYFFTAIALASATTQGYFLPKIINRIGERWVIITGLFLMGLGLLLLPITPNLILLIMFFMMMGVGSALNRPTAEGIISRRAKLGQGVTMGVAQSFESLGRVIGPLLGGILFGTSSFLPFLLSAGILFILVLCILKIKKPFREDSLIPS